MSARNVVLFDGQCSFCRTSQRLVEWLDWIRLLRWVPFQSREAAASGIPREQLEERMYLVAGPRNWSGFAAWKKILLKLPLLYLLIALTVWVSPWLLVGWVLLFVPVTEPIGEWVYDRIARNRFRLPGATCQRPDWD